MNTLENIAQRGIGVTVSTYFRFGYPIYADDEKEMGIFHVATFGLN